MTTSGRTPTASVVVVGPTHPYTGGIAQHTTRLAWEISNRGIDTVLESWRAQYPSALHKGTARVPRDRPELPPFPRTRERLAWYSPLSWLLAGWRARAASDVLLTVVTPFHAVPYLVLMATLGRRARRTALAHNVLPHEQGPGDRLLARALLLRCDRVIVHSRAQAELALRLGVDGDRVVVAELPFPGIVGAEDVPPPPALDGATAPHVLFFGTVRRYKGVDLLLAALAAAPGVRLTVAGDFWDPLEGYEALAREHGVAQRVRFLPGYVDARDIPRLVADADAFVLPYRSGTASIVTDLAHLLGRPVIATRVGTLAESVRHDVDGLLIEPEDVEALGSAIRSLSEPGVLARLARGVSRGQERQRREWEDYALAVLTR